MRRREFIVALGAAAGWPRITSAQSSIPLVGIVSGGSMKSFAAVEPAFREGLAEGGFVGGRNVVVETRWADGQFDRLPSLAADLIGQHPAAIITQTLPAALAAKAATSTIPVVFVIGEDPVKAGLVASFGRPGGNVTGLTHLMNQLGAKRLELFSEAVPHTAVLALLVNPDNPNAEPDTRDLQEAAALLGRRLEVLTAKTEHEIEAAFAVAAERNIGALFVSIDPFFFGRREHFVRLAARHRVPTVYPLREYVRDGGLMSYGANFASAWRQSGGYVASILKGVRPADLPVLQPTKFELVINLTTAKALGLHIPPLLLARADEVIE